MERWRLALQTCVFSTSFYGPKACDLQQSFGSSWRPDAFSRLPLRLLWLTLLAQISNAYPPLHLPQGASNVRSSQRASNLSQDEYMVSKLLHERMVVANSMIKNQVLLEKSCSLACGLKAHVILHAYSREWAEVWIHWPQSFPMNIHSCAEPGPCPGNLCSDGSFAWSFFVPKPTLQALCCPRSGEVALWVVTELTCLSPS